MARPVSEITGLKPKGGFQMAKTRTLTIASMANVPGSVYIEDATNIDMMFSAISHSSIKVERSSDGRTYTWESNTDHIRIFIKMDGPSDLPVIHTRGTGAGWFQLEDFPQIQLNAPGLVAETLETRAW